MILFKTAKLNCVQLFLFLPLYPPPSPLFSQEYASPTLVQNKLEKARIVPAFLVTANQTEAYSVSRNYLTRAYVHC